MNRFENLTKPLMVSVALLLVALTAGCKGGYGKGDPILGGGGIAVLAPTVTAVTPLNRAINVPFSTTTITATFSEPMAWTAGEAFFTVTAAAPAPNPVGTVSLDGTNRIATFTATANLAPLTVYTASVTGARSLATGLPLASPYVWSFTTGVAAALPTVTVTVPATTVPGPTPNVPIDTLITATFSENVLGISATSFTVTAETPAVSPAGAVSYVSGTRTARFAPTAPLAYSTTYTATITTAVTNVAGYALARNYVWTFTTPSAPDLIRPRVTLTVPATTIPGPTANVPINTAIAAAFTEPMNASTITAASFTLIGPGNTAVTGGLTYVVASNTLVFTPGAFLANNSTYTATITTTATDLAGNQLAGNQAALPAASNYVWTFTTSVAPDTTRPRVTLTVPATTIPGPTLNVSTNTAISAAFTEPMNASTITVASFTVTGPGATVVTGGVTYVSQSAIFTPAAVLADSTTYTATITTTATDLAGNQLAGNQAALPAASNYVWTFTTSPALDTVPPTIIITNPADLDIGVAMNSAVNATFSEAMDLSIATFTVQLTGPPLGPILNGAIAYDPFTFTVTFTPTSNFAINSTYTATINGAKDLAGNALIAGLVPNPWTFTTGNGLAPGAVDLGSAAAFGIMATSAITNTGAATIINGDVSLDPGTSCGLLPAQVNGTIHINDTVSAQARIDLLAAYNFAKALPPGTTIPGGADLGALYPTGIPPGTYTSGSTMLVSTPLVLDAGGNANAVWVFQIGSSLTTGASVTRANGAQAKNVFWVPTASATIGVGTIFNGNIVAGVSATGNTGALIYGRILAGAIGAGTIALDTNTVNVPTP